MNREELARSLLLYGASGQLPIPEVASAVGILFPEKTSRPPAREMIDALLDHGDPSVASLAKSLRMTRRREAVQHYERRRGRLHMPTELQANLSDLPSDAPLGWRTQEEALGHVKTAIGLLIDRFFLIEQREKAPELFTTLEKKYEEVATLALEAASSWGHSPLLEILSELEKSAGPIDPLRQQIVKSLEEAVRVSDVVTDQALEALAARFVQSTDRVERRAILDRVCTWPTDHAASVLLGLSLEPWAQERAQMILTLRFGQMRDVAWAPWKTWLEAQEHRRQAPTYALRALGRRRPAALLYLWYSRQAGADPEILRLLEKELAKDVAAVTLEEFIERWSMIVMPGEARALTGQERPSVEPPPAEVSVQEAKSAPTPSPSPAPPRVAKSVASAPRRVEPPPRPPAPSVWEVHLKPFILANWYMVAGVVMVVVGSSLLAYYTWDKHWLIRYTLMPSLLGAFTSALAWMGGWIERKDSQFKGTAAVLRSAAIGLLPVNFMAVALLANDSLVASSQKMLAVPLMGAIYLGFFGWSLRRWCSAVHPAIGWTLGGTILFLNALVTLAPLAKSFGAAGTGRLLPIAAAGFYLGFAALSATVLHFTRRVLTGELAKERRVPWFLGAALAVTFVQVFAWVHGYLRALPHGPLYAPMVVLTGGLVLSMERRTLELRGQGDRHGAESFLGFAFILLGILLGFVDPVLRILTLALAGAVWIRQSLPRRQPLHAWIGLTFLTLSVASIGFLKGFPPVAPPALGIGAALGMGALAAIFRKEETLARAATGMQAAILFITLVVAVLVRVEFGSPPPATAGATIAIAAMFGWRAWRDQKIAWVHTAMVVLALTLPHLTEAVRPGVLVLGLAVLSLVWIGVVSAVRTPILLRARSTVLWIYGALALVATALLRGSLHAAAEPLWLDMSGLLLMTAAMILAAWFSRSLVPSGMAMVFGAILLSTIRGHLRTLHPGLEWGSGLDSSVAAIVFTLWTFALQRSPRLKALGEGDRFLGREPYPLQRLDHTLFTWPLLAAALLLVVKVETWNFLTNLAGHGVTPRVSIALGLSGVAWTLFAVYHRTHRLAAALTTLGLLWMIVGLAFGASHAVRGDWPSIVLVEAIFFQMLFFGYRFLLEPRCAWASNLLTRPTRYLLRAGSVTLSLIGVLFMAHGMEPGALRWLLLVLAAQLAWHGVASKNLIFGLSLAALVWATLLAGTTPGDGLLAERLWAARSIVPTLWMIVAIQALQAALETKRSLYDFLKPLLVPFQGMAVALAGVLGVTAIGSGLADVSFSAGPLTLVLVALLMTARAVRSGSLAFLSVLAAYVWIHSFGHAAKINSLSDPWHLSLLGLSLALLGNAGRRVDAAFPRILTGTFAPTAIRWPVAPWFFIPAGTIAVGTAIAHTAIPELRETPTGLWAPYLGATTLGVIALSVGWLTLLHGCGALLTLGNVHLVRVVLGPWMRTHQVTEIHLICLGVALTLLQASAIRRLVRREEIQRMVARANLAWAGLILALLSANYLVHPNLELIGPFRFGVSGAMSLLAGLYFRRAARHPVSGQESAAAWCEGFYHFGVTMSLWCAALMVPFLRNPVFALVALGLPVLYFYARAEFRRHERYRNSAATLGFLVLALYVLRPVVQMVIFPQAPFETMYYHRNAPLIFLLGLILLRLRALGGTSWLAFYGGLAVMGSTYFAVTALPGLSPFRHPVESAWVAIALAHFFTLASVQRSPIRTAIERWAAIDAAGWQSLRRPWGVCLLVASQGMALWGILEFEARPLMVAPLLLGAASVWIHQGVLRGSHLYQIIARIQIALALHMGFLLKSYLPAGDVLWAILAIWAVLLAVDAGIPIRGMAGHVALLGALAVAHVFYHEPASSAGLVGMGLASLLSALTPRPSRSAESGIEKAAAAALPWTPAWLVGFSQAHEFSAWTILVTAAIVFATGTAALILHWKGTPASPARLRARLFDQTISWMRESGATIHSAALWISFIATAIVQAIQPGTPFEHRELFLIVGLYAAFGVAWVFEGKSRKAMAPYFLMKACVLGAFLAARQELFVARHFWSPEYDLWASLAAFFGLVAAKERLNRQPREMRLPFTVTLLVLPLFTIAWGALHHMSTEMALLVVGLESAAFAYIGREDRESPHHLVAVCGFVAFVLLLFWSKLQLRVVYAYVVPVGVGVLVLLQLFRKRVPVEVRNGVRATTLVAMLASAGYYALVDSGMPLAHNLALILLCLLAMGLGGLLRVRLYLALGFGALMIDLMALFVKIVMHMERSVKMTLVGSMVLLLGAALVFGAIWVKTHQKELSAAFERWRLRFAGWE